MYFLTRKTLCIISLSLLLAIIFSFWVRSLPLIDLINWKLYDALVKVRIKFTPVPSAINDILLVTIDNDTLKNMPKRWPYPRADFARAIKNLQNAEAKVIGFDFVFLGESTDEDDQLLKTTFTEKNKIVFAAAVDEEGLVDLSAISNLNARASYGIISKLQDSDEITRRGITYLTRDKNPHKGILSWEMQILRIAKDINLLSLKSQDAALFFKNNLDEEWRIPVEADTKSFLINFRAHTYNFHRLSFYRVVTNDFNHALVKNKIVLVGLLSSLFQDLHNTPLGFLPGLTLNANAFLTLYTQDFIKNVPKQLELFSIILGVILSASLLSFLSPKTKVLLALMAVEISALFILSYFLLLQGYIWNYSLLICNVSFSPLLSERIIRFFKPL